MENKTESKEIATKRLLLRKLHKEDRGFFYKLLSDREVKPFSSLVPGKVHGRSRAVPKRKISDRI